MTEKENKDNKSKMIYWALLLQLPVAIIAYWETRKKKHRKHRLHRIQRKAMNWKQKHLLFAPLFQIKHFR